MARTAQSDKQIAKKKSAIVEAAAEVFALRGIAATSMNHVAARLGCGKGTLYNYFPKRDDLVLAVLDWLVELQTASLEQQPHASRDSATQAIADYMEGILAMRVQVKQAFNLAMDLWAAAIAERSKSQLREQFQKSYKVNREFLGEILAKGQQSGEFRGDFDPTAMASLLFGAWDGLIFQAWLDPNFDVQTPARQHLQALLRGIQAKQTTSGEQE